MCRIESLRCNFYSLTPYFLYFVTHDLYNMCTLQHVHFATRALCNMRTLQPVHFAHYNVHSTICIDLLYKSANVLARQISWTDNFFLFEALTSLHIRRLTFQFVLFVSYIVICELYIVICVLCIVLFVL